jgi:hypothetical protein
LSRETWEQNVTIFSNVIIFEKETTLSGIRQKKYLKYLCRKNCRRVLLSSTTDRRFSGRRTPLRATLGDCGGCPCSEAPFFPLEIWLRQYTLSVAVVL